MEGFYPASGDLRSVVIVRIGYREADGDWLVNLKKVRRPRQQLVSKIA